MKMEEMVHASDTCETELLATLERSFAGQHSSTHRKWWVPLLLCMGRDGEGEREGRTFSSSLLTLQSAIEQGQDAYSRFKRCSDVRGLILLLGIEFEELQTARTTAIRSTYCPSCVARYHTANMPCHSDSSTLFHHMFSAVPMHCRSQTALGHAHEQRDHSGL